MNEPIRDPGLRQARDPLQAGFTLVEIMVVIVILGLLATLVTTNVLSMSDDAKITKAQTDVKTIFDNAKLYKIQNPTSRVPTMEDLTTPDERGKTYIEAAMQDPWGNDYIIRELDRGQFEVISAGPDGSEGTEDDISSRRKDKN